MNIVPSSFKRSAGDKPPADAITMSSLAARPSATDDETLYIGAVKDIEVDSTGAGSPPPSTFEASLPFRATTALNNVSVPATVLSANAEISSIGFSDLASEDQDHATRPVSLQEALGQVLVISGGSGFNDLVGATPGATYVMPISDNGGSSSEIIRVLGGPSIGDLRSRLNRLIPTPSRQDHQSASSFSSPPPPQSNEAIHNLLSYRLPSHGSSREIKQEWMDILEGRHRLWRGIEPERKEVIRGFLVHFESEVLRRAHRHFNFRGGSIGNFFLAAAQKFFRSIQSAIFLFSATTQISTSSMASKVLPVINTNHTATIAAELEDGDIIVGQCEISHPAPKPVKAGGLGAGGGANETWASQPPGTPSSAVWDTQRQQQERSMLLHSPNHELLVADAMRGMGMSDGGPSTPGFGPPAHYHINEPFASSDSTSMNASVDAVKVNMSDSEAQKVRLSWTPSAATARSGLSGHSPLFAQLVDERAAAYAAQARKGLTTVGNQKDGLDPADDDQDSQDGLDQLDSPRDASAAEDDASLDASTASVRDAVLRPTGSPRRSGSTRKEKTGNIIFTKADPDHETALASRIRRILYVNAYRNEIYPAPNPSFVCALSRSRTMIYSCGSLWTSIVPCLSLRSIATSIATSRSLTYKVLLLNTVQDRETRGMSAIDFVDAICTSLNQSDSPNLQAAYPPNQLITHLVYFQDGQVDVDKHRFQQMGITCVAANSSLRNKSGTPMFDEASVSDALRQICIPK